MIPNPFTKSLTRQYLCRKILFYKLFLWKVTELLGLQSGRFLFELNSWENLHFMRENFFKAQLKKCVYNCLNLRKL